MRGGRGRIFIGILGQRQVTPRWADYPMQRQDGRGRHVGIGGGGECDIDDRDKASSGIA